MLILYDVIPQDGNVVVPVWSTLFVIEPNGMKEFMCKNVVTVTTTAQIETLVSPIINSTFVTNMGRTSTISFD